MNHYLLPENTDTKINHFRYGNDSLEYMLREMHKMGASPENLKASVFGGSSMFQEKVSFYNVGGRNISLAKDFLTNKGISIRTTDTGGNLGRKIIFDTNTGIISNYYLTGKR